MDDDSEFPECSSLDIADVYQQNDGQQADGSEKKHVCGYCGKPFSKGYLRLHLAEHTGNKPYTCFVCCKSFASAPLLKSHMVSHSDRKEHACPVCNKSFTLAIQLQRHTITHSDIKQYTCHQCQKTFKRSSTLINHVKAVHSGLKPPGIYVCSSCEMRFRDRYNLMRHMSTHLKPQPFSCIACKKRFSDKDSIRNHTRFSCRGRTKEYSFLDSSVVKPECSSSSCSRSSFAGETTDADLVTATHETDAAEQQQKHSIGKDNNLASDECTSVGNASAMLLESEHRRACIHCGKFFTKYYLMHHMARQHGGGGENPYSCRTCEQTFPSAAQLKSHALTSHGSEKQHRCESCDKKFHTSTQLQIHELSHRNSQDFPCMNCEKRFKAVMYLKRHFKIMHADAGVSAFSCSECRKNFRDRHGLERHMVTHTKLKPHSCECCGKRYSDKSSLRNHSKICKQERELTDCDKRAGEIHPETANLKS